MIQKLFVSLCGSGFQNLPLQGSMSAGSKALLTLVPNKGSALVLISFLGLIMLFLRPGMCVQHGTDSPLARALVSPHRADVCREPHSHAVIILQQLWQETVPPCREGGTASQASSLEKSKMAT